VSVAILVITILVVMLVLYFVINSSIIRQKRELGIQKAIGFTTFQLMNQVTLGFLPPVAVGVILGCTLGITQMNALMSVAERTACVMKTDYVIVPSWVVLCGLAIFAAAYLISMLITYRIRKISAYALVSE
jgi:putative ABC transport system permease protein